MQAIQRHPRHITNQYVFCNAEGNPYDNITKSLKAAAARAGIEDGVRLHQLRHCFLSYSQMQGVDPRTAQKWADTTEFLLGDAGFVQAQMPFVTMTLSGWREAKLLREARTSALSAAKNLILDVVGTGVGAAGGAEVLATFGGVLGGPLGAAAGAMIGAVAGGLLGRKASNHLKLSHLREARDNFFEACRDYRNEVRRNSQAMQCAYERDKGKAEEQLKEHAIAQRDRIAHSVAAIRDWHRDTSSVPPQEVSELIDAASDELLELSRQRWGEVRHRLLLFLIWPRTQEFAVITAICRIRASLKALRRIDPNSVRSRWQVYRALAGNGLQNERISSFVEEIEQERRQREGQLRTVVKEAQQTMVEKRLAAMQWLAGKLEILRAENQRILMPAMERVRSTSDRVSEEAQKLGGAAR